METNTLVAMTTPRTPMATATTWRTWLLLRPGAQGDNHDHNDNDAANDDDNDHDGKNVNDDNGIEKLAAVEACRRARPSRR